VAYFNQQLLCVQGENTLEETLFSPVEAAVARTPAASPAGVTGATTPGTPAVIVEVAKATSPEKAPGLEQDFIPTVQTKTEKNRKKRKRYRMNKKMKKAAQVC
jgi:hypothetical protein